MVAELEAANRKLEQLSMSDGLTGIANRRCFDLHLGAQWQCHVAAARPLALLLVDVDYFKALNDARGHLCGDECLRALATLCSEQATGADELVARYGGEEFALLLPECGLHTARRRAEALRLRVQSLAIPHPRSHIADCLTVSIGASVVVPNHAQSPQLLIGASDRALYAAKAGGRNRVSTRAVQRRIPARSPASIR